MLLKFKNIRSILFLTYTLIIVIVFTVLVLWFYHWTSDLLRRNAAEALRGMGQSLQESIDAEIQKMDDVALNVMYSNLVRNNFRKYLAELETSAASGSPSARTAGTVEAGKELTDILTAVVGPSRPVEQLYLYDFQGMMYGNGFDNGERSYRPDEKAWFHTVMTNTKGKYIHPPVPDEDMSRFRSSREAQYSISLFRQIYDSYNVPIAIVEVKQYYSKVFENAIGIVRSRSNGENVLVFNEQGRLIYPIDGTGDAFSSYFSVLGTNAADSGRNFALVNPRTGERELVSAHVSERTGWTTMLIVSEAKLLEPLSRFAKQTVLVAVGVLLFAIALSFAAARRITLPLLKLHRTIRNIRLDDIGSGSLISAELSSGLSEMDQLHQSFVNMRARLKQSMDDLLLSQSQELQAKLLALQSQMNPHFLYNTLATIHAMAEENMNAQIVRMTENMSDFLRYFSSDESSVKLSTELMHTRKYLDINQIRFGEKLQYEFRIDDSLLQLHMPKLLVQPLVENALKFATKSEPPWRIQVIGTLADGRWTLEVCDNGPGFTDASLSLLRERMDEVDRTNVIPTLELNGMGLLNIYIRLKLLYGADTLFEASNRAGGGASIRIGGTWKEGR
ncbi:sensor histidine kinase [Paenibacillus sp.]|uniref:cache domain-containing sensor histidine kinase n=1 Tax=Paenibacillus sp. TaxID=58172 RepID=UPI002D5DBEA9|nr:sensor histidine kinase [Paenibacillus sp.]HZG87841.1 sensor histidine kinase [Paenibacillus sp.]